MVATGPAKRYAGRITPYVVLTCVVAASGGALFGCALRLSLTSCISLGYHTVLYTMRLHIYLKVFVSLTQ